MDALRPGSALLGKFSFQESKDMQLRVKIGPKLGIGNFQEVQTLDGAAFQVGELTVPYADHAATPATVANLRANGFYRDGENIWIDEAADPLP